MLIDEILFEQDWTVDAYHGTTADFNEFKNKGFAQLGYHFGSTPNQANRRIKGKRTGAQVMPVKLKLKNPLYVHDMEDWSPSSVIWGLRYSYDKKQEKIPAPLNALLQKLSKDFHEMDFNGRAAAISEIGEIWHKNNYPHRNETPKLSKLRDKIFAKHARENEDAQSKMLIDGLKSLGYDGIVYDNRYEGEGVSYLVFDSNQVRSRFAKFDPSKADSGIITDSIIFEKVDAKQQP